MKDIREHWVFKQTLDQIKPLGEAKYERLMKFLLSKEYAQHEKQLIISDVIQFAESDARRAAVIWIIYKHDIENNTLGIEGLDPIMVWDKPDKIEEREVNKAYSAQYHKPYYD